MLQSYTHSNGLSNPSYTGNDYQFYHLEAHHRKELERSVISPGIIGLNFRSLSGTNVYNYLMISPDLERRNDGRLAGNLAKWGHLEKGGWWCSGIDPLTLEPSNWGCFKPDDPQEDPKKPGKLIKYVQNPKTPTGVFVLNLANEDVVKIKEVSAPDCPDDPAQFWGWVLENPVPITVTEGSKKTAAGLSAGYITIGLPGIYNGYRAKDEHGNPKIPPRLIPELEAFCAVPREFIFAFDNDPKEETQRAVANAQKQTANLLSKQGATVSVMRWGGTAKGIDDLLANPDGTERFAHAWEKRKPLEVEGATPKADRKKLCLELATSGLSGADYEDEINRIATETKTHPNEIRRLVESIDETMGRIEARPETFGEVILLNDAEKHSIALGEVIPEWLAGPINNLAAALNIRPETYLLPLLCGLSGTFKRGTRLIVHQGLGFEVSPQLYGAIVAPSSQKKTPVLNAVGLKALSLLQSKASQNYQAALAQYRQDCARYKSLSGEDLETEFPDGPPKEPTMEVYFVDNTTTEGLLSLISKQDRGISIFCDELSGFFMGFDQYKKSGNDAQQFLELYGGADKNIHRKKDGSTFIEKPIVSIAGGIQPSVLERLFKNGDGSGQWARFMFVRQPAAAAELSLDGVTFDLSGMINSLYQSFADLPAITFNLTREACALYLEHHNRYERERVADSDHPLNNVWGKAGTWIGKLAIILHCIAYSAGEIPELIGVDVIAQAVKLTDFFISQSRVLYAELMGGAGNQLSAQLNKVLNLAGRNGGSCTARDVLRAKIAKKTPDAIALFEELKGMGLGTVSKDGRSIRFSLPESMSPNVTPLSPDCHPECHQLKPLQDKDLGEIVTNVTQNFQIQNVTTPATTPEMSPTPTAPTFPPPQKSLSTKDGDIGDNVALTQSGQTIGVGDNSGDNSGDIDPSGDNSGDIDPQPCWPGPIPVNARGEVDRPAMSRYNKAQIDHLGWTKEQARSFAKELTGKERRELMTDDELIKVTQAFNKLCAEHNPHAC